MLLFTDNEKDQVVQINTKTLARFFSYKKINSFLFRLSFFVGFIVGKIIAKKREGYYRLLFLKTNINNLRISTAKVNYNKQMASMALLNKKFQADAVSSKNELAKFVRKHDTVYDRLNNCETSLKEVHELIGSCDGIGTWGLEDRLIMLRDWRNKDYQRRGLALLKD